MERVQRLGVIIMMVPPASTRYLLHRTRVHIIFLPVVVTAGYTSIPFPPNTFTAKLPFPKWSVYDIILQNILSTHVVRCIDDVDDEFVSNI